MSGNDDFMAGARSDDGEIANSFGDPTASPGRKNEAGDAIDTYGVFAQPRPSWELPEILPHEGWV
jgi:hypothetical protein